MNNPIKLFLKNEDSEKNTKNIAAELDEPNTFEFVKVDLRELGYKKVVATGGNLESLKNLLQDLCNGHLIDANEDE